MPGRKSKPKQALCSAWELQILLWLLSGALCRLTQIPSPVTCQEATTYMKTEEGKIHEMGLKCAVNQTARDSLLHANTNTRTHMLKDIHSLEG